LEKYIARDEQYWSTYSLDRDFGSNIGDTASVNLGEPLVSSKLVNCGYSPFYPDEKKFAICLTHDVDEVFIPWIHRAHSLVSSINSLSGENLEGAFVSLFNKKRSPYLDFEVIMDLEEKFDSKSTFFFLASKKDPVRHRYDIEDIETELGLINDRGFEVGLHGGYYSYKNLEALTEEKCRLEEAAGSKVVGYRSHYLNLQIPDTWLILDKLGFLFDSTLGYRRSWGFRNGMCHPFQPYVGDAMRVSLLEVPLIIMDAAHPLWGFSVAKYWDEVQRMIDCVEACKGVLTLNWHNDSLLATRKNEYAKLYSKILEEGKRKGAWFANCREVSSWWNTHQSEFEAEVQST
jgi:peptidoglycan/xylan/chitin deacetylase (PgdA/CDA1 family)